MKKIAITFGVFLGIVLIVFLVLEVFVDLNAYKGQIIAPMEERLHRKVDIGNIAHTLFKGPGATIQDVTIFDQEQNNVFVRSRISLRR